MFKKKDEEQVEEEILSIVEEGQDQGFIHEEEAEMISNILDFDDKDAHDIMTARSRIFAIEAGKTVEEALSLKDTFMKMIRGKVSEDELELLEEASSLQDISHMPARVKCAVLGWRTLGEIFGGQDDGRTEEESDE